MEKFNINLLLAAIVASLLFIAIVSLGISLAILPIYINQLLELPPIFVGAVIAIESVSTLFSRAFSGRFSDNKGPKKGMILGLFLMFCAGLMAFIIISLSGINAYIAFIFICISRIFMGIGESLVFTCSGTWPIGLVGREHAGKIMSWVGVAMFLGLALGNYFGAWSYETIGILYASFVMFFLPFIGIFLVIFIRSVEVHNELHKISLRYAIKRIWKSGAGFACANVGYASITSFLLLFFMSHSWQNSAAIGLASFGVGYVLSRVSLGWLADSSGLKLTLISLFIEAIGLLLITIATHPYVATIGSFLTGFGLSMVYPLLALPAIKSLPENNIGLALSTYESCFDIGILISGMIGSWIASYFGFQSIFLFSFFCCLIAMICSVLAYQQLKSDVNSIKDLNDEVTKI